MNITSGQKKAAIFGAVLIVGGAAFVYFDPLDMDLLGLKPAPVQIAPKPVLKPLPQSVPTKQPSPQPVPAVTPVITQAVAPEAPVVPVPEKPLVKPKAKPLSPPSVDLRHCLDQPTDMDIAKCANE